MEDRVPIFLERHLRRLKKSVHALGLRMPPRIGAPGPAMQAVLGKAPRRGKAVLRIHVYAGPTPRAAARAVHTLEGWLPQRDRQVREGVRLRLEPTSQAHGAPLASTTSLYLSVDEDQVGDSERGHTTEQVGYVAFVLSGSAP